MGNWTELDTTEILDLKPEDVPAGLVGLPLSIVRLPLPRIPSGISWEDLDLRVRTERRIRKLAKSPEGLSELTLGDLARLSGFGRRSLFDLLQAIRTIRESASNDPFVQKEGQVIQSEAALGGLALNLDVRSLPASLNHLPTSTARLPLPELGEDTTWDDLRLQVRTEKRLRCLVTRPSELCKVTVGELGRVPGFGKSSLLDLLNAIRRIRKGSSPIGGTTELAKATHGRINPLQHEERPAITTLETELSGLLEIIRKRRYRKIVARYLGWDGRGGTTLQNAGQEFGITRERVRQICARFLRWLEGKRPAMPVLDEVLLVVADSPQGLADDVEGKLVVLGLTERPFRMGGVIKAAEVLGRDINIKVKEFGNQRFVVRRGEGKIILSVLRMARQSLKRWGTATVSDIAAQVGVEATCQVEEPKGHHVVHLVSKVLESQRDFRWLDKSGGWFWFFEPLENALFTRIRKVLAIAERVNVSELRMAISRDRRMRGFSPPKRVLTELCRQAPWCQVEDNEVIIAKPTIPIESNLSKNEKLIVEILKSSGSFMESSELEECCMNAGMTRPTFWALVSGSSIVLRYAPRVYGLVGARIEPGVIDSVSPSRRSGRVLVDYGWLHDRQIWVGYRLSRGMIRNGLIAVPAALRGFLVGEYKLSATDGARIGTLVVRENSGWGLGPFYSRRGGEPGDSLIVQFESQ